MAHRGYRALSGAQATALLLPAFSYAGAQEESRLLRFPNIHGNTVVFTFAGDLYTVPPAGGEAKRLTSHEGFELFGRFSPGGRWIALSGWIAFSGEYPIRRAPGGGD